MTNMNRRRVLTTAVLGGAGIVGATAFGSVAPEAAFAAEPEVSMEVMAGAPDPNFAEGIVSGIDGGVLSVTGSEWVLHRIRVTDATSIWKLRPTTLDRVAVGDGLYARGARLGDGTLAADAVWVNIVNLHAHIRGIGRNTLQLDHRGQPIVAHVVPGVTAASYNGTPAVADLSLLRVGRHVQVLGAWHPGSNEIDIATVYAAA